MNNTIYNIEITRNSGAAFDHRRVPGSLRIFGRAANFAAGTLGLALVGAPAGPMLRAGGNFSLGLGLLLAMLCASALARAQSAPGWVAGQIITAPMLNKEFSLKQNYSATLYDFSVLGQSAAPGQFLYFSAQNTPALGTYGSGLSLIDGVLTSTATGGSIAALNVGTRVDNPGTGTAESLLQIQTNTAQGSPCTSTCVYSTPDLFKKTRRSNAGSAMTDTLPASTATGMNTIGGAWMHLYNADASASDTITAGAGTTIAGSSTYVLLPGRDIWISYDLANTEWRFDGNTNTALLTNQLGTGVQTALGDAPNATGGFVTYSGNFGAAAGTLSTAAQPNVTSLGTLTFLGVSGNATFGGGTPWIDVTSGANGCAAAVGNGSTNDRVAIQCQLTYAKAHSYLPVFFPCGVYLINGGGLTVGGAVVLFSATNNNNGCVAIEVTDDETALNFDTSASHAALRNLTIYGYQNSAATADAVIVDYGADVDMTNVTIWGGNWALYNGGVDGTLLNCFISGWGTNGGAVLSEGTNWYIRDKLDTTGQSTGYAFYQNGYFTTGSSEDHIIESDLSGAYISSLLVGSSNSILTITNSVLGPTTGGASFTISNSKVVMASDNEVTANGSVAGGPLLLSNSWGQGAITISHSGSGTATCSNNYSITC